MKEKLGTSEVLLVIAIVQKVMKTAIDMLIRDNNDHRVGGHFVLMDHNENVVLLQMQILNYDIDLVNIPSDKAQRYYTNALEKATRLARKIPAFDHYSSWQSRDPDNNQYGGAIRAGNFILSFSGLPELMDEAMMLQVAHEANLGDPQELVLAAQLSQNQLWAALSNHRLT